ncbi:hypothetical protein [Desulfovibrio cuneatus]|uniref:hypothetical protein n=1 Tax=Desulfovibrio cuneatus TaxID=159728 RepID=UPI0004266DC1|nr:hypothetical protein [Desulfovibrio cuneatus]
MSTPALSALIQLLRNTAASIRSIEAKAEVALQAHSSTTFRDLMEEKATMLAELADNACPLGQALAPEESVIAMNAIKQFSTSAEAALGLGSHFYMFALLYPDTHVKGTPNNLDLLIERLCALQSE